MLENTVTPCRSCGSTDPDSAHYEDDLFCDECSISCHRCHEPHHEDDATAIYGGDYSCCSSCTARYYSYCEGCDYYVDDGVFCYTVDGDTRCESCAESAYYCESCDEHHSDGACDNEEEEDGDLIHYYSYTPYLNFYGTPAHDVFVGVEIEVEVDGNRYDVARQARESFGERVYCKSDGSLSNGVEMVFHPHSLTQFQSLPWDGILCDLKGAGAKAARSAGMHVHVSRDGFTGEFHLWKFLNLVYSNEGPVTKLAGRSGSRWAQFVSDPDAIKSHAKKGTYADRYLAVNVQNDATVEVRIFACSLRKERILARVEFVAAAVEYTRELSASDVAANGLSFANFHLWLSGKDEYKNLHTYLGTIENLYEGAAWAFLTVPAEYQPGYIAPPVRRVGLVLEENGDTSQYDQYLTRDSFDEDGAQWYGIEVTRVIDADGLEYEFTGRIRQEVCHCCTTYQYRVTGRRVSVYTGDYVSSDDGQAALAFATYDEA